MRFANSASLSQTATGIAINASSLSIPGTLTLGEFAINSEMASLGAAISSLQAATATLNANLLVQQQKLNSIAYSKTPVASHSVCSCDASTIPMMGSSTCTIVILSAKDVATAVAPSEVSVSSSPDGLLCCRVAFAFRADQLLLLCVWNGLENRCDVEFAHDVALRIRGIFVYRQHRLCCVLRCDHSQPSPVWHPAAAGVPHSVHHPYVHRLHFYEIGWLID